AEKSGAIQRQLPVRTRLLPRTLLCQRFKSGAQPTFGRDWKITLGNASSPSVGVHSGLPEDVRVAFCETSRHASGLAGVSGWTQAVRRTSPAWGVSQGTVLASG